MRKEYKNNFEQIYQAALKQDPGLLPNGIYCIDEFKEGTYGLSAAAQLASEGKKDAVQWLLQRGANINWVAFWAAALGNQKWANELMDQGADIKWLVWGATAGRHKELTMDLVELDDKEAGMDVIIDVAEMRADTNWTDYLIKKGSVFRGHFSARALQTDRQKLASIQENVKTPSQLLWAAHRAAMDGHRKLVLELIKKGANRIPTACAAAEGGHRDLVYEIIGKGDDIIENETIKNGIIENAAIGGHRELALEFIEKRANITSPVLSGRAIEVLRDDGLTAILEGSAYEPNNDINRAATGALHGGHWTLVLELIDKGANINKIAHRAAASWEWKFIFKLIEKGANIPAIAEAVCARFTITKSSHELWILSHFNNAQQRAQFIKALKTTSVPVHIQPATAIRANRIGRLMQVYGYDYPFALMSTSNVRPHGALATLAGLVGCQQSELQQLPFAYEMWLKIFESVFDSKVSSEQFDQLGFLTIRLLLIHQLKHCESETKDQLILLALSKNNIDELAQWVSEQHKTFASKDKGKEKTNDIKTPSTLREIFSLWHQRLGSPVNAEEGASNQAAKDFKSENAAA